MFIPLTPIRFLHRAVDLYGEKIGVVCGNRQFTYSQFGDRCQRLAAALPLQNIEPGDRVAYLSFNTHKLLEGYFGIPQAHAVLAPLNVRLSILELVQLLNHSGAKMLIFEKEFAPHIARFRSECPAIARYVGADDAAEADLTFEEMIASGEPKRADIFDYDENSIAGLFYTGGSTGTPKGVMLSHRTLYLHAISGAILSKDPETAVNLYTIPLFHANGWGNPHMATLLGITHVLLRGFDPAAVFASIEQHRATQMNLIPVMAHMLLQFPTALAYDRTSMRDIHVGGAPCSPQLFERLERLFPNAHCVNGYGLTETSPFLSYPPPKKTDQEEDSERRARQASIGWPIMGASLRVVDEHLHDVPRNGAAIGEIVAMGDNVMDGYYADPAGTAASMVGPWLRTGDLGVRNPDGSIRFVDRSKDLIISGGENISSLEVETAVLAHPAVQECAVVSAPDEKWGEVPVAIVVPKPNESLTSEDLLAFLPQRLARFKLPKRVEIRQQPLPRSSTLKVQKMTLREKYWQGHSTRVNA